MCNKHLFIEILHFIIDCFVIVARFVNASDVSSLIWDSGSRRIGYGRIICNGASIGATDVETAGVIAVATGDGGIGAAEIGANCVQNVIQKLKDSKLGTSEGDVKT